VEEHLDEYQWSEHENIPVSLLVLIFNSRLKIETSTMCVVQFRMTS